MLGRHGWLILGLTANQLVSLRNHWSLQGLVGGEVGGARSLLRRLQVLSLTSDLLCGRSTSLTACWDPCQRLGLRQCDCSPLVLDVGLALDLGSDSAVRTWVLQTQVLHRLRDLHLIWLKTTYNATSDHAAIGDSSLHAMEE